MVSTTVFREVIVIDFWEGHFGYGKLTMIIFSKKSTRITTNRAMKEWPKYLGNDSQCCTACVDRFLHHSIRIHFTGRSYRLASIRRERLAGNPDSKKMMKEIDGE